MRRYYFLIIVSCCLSACSLFSINKPEQRITLFIQNAERSKEKPLSASIAFTNTTTSPFLTTNSIIIRDGNLLTKLKGAVWTDSISSLINYNILSALRSSSRFTSISTDADGIIAYYTLQTSLVKWNIEKENNEYYVTGELYANIISKRQGKIFAHHEWKLRKKIDSLTIDKVSIAFQEIITEIIPDFITWAEATVEKIEGEKMASSPL